MEAGNYGFVTFRDPDDAMSFLEVSTTAMQQAWEQQVRDHI